MKASRLVSAYRFALAALIIAAIVATFVHTSSLGPINLFNFFGYFTVQSNAFLALILLLAASFAASGLRRPSWLDLVRGLVTAYIIIVGLVYALLLAPLGAAGGVPVPWANVVLHVIAPIAAALDWLLIADRGLLPWRLLPTVIVYPVLWLAVVLARGATDGWFPYPFLDPATGYGSIAVVCVGIALVTIAVGALVFWASRANRSRREQPQ